MALIEAGDALESYRFARQYLLVQASTATVTRKYHLTNIALQILR
jgi:hypothetical protein